MRELGLEFIGGFGLPPVPFIELAAELGCQHVSLAPTPIDYNPEGYAPFSVRDDAALRRDIVRVQRDTGVTISLGEGLCLFDAIDVREAYAADLDAFAEIGAPRINVCSFDPDQGRGFDQLAALTEMAAVRSIVTLIEFVPIFAIGDLATALAAVHHVGRPECRLMIDTMHVSRTATPPSALATLDPALIDYVQLCDAPLVPTNPDYMDEAMYQRMVPGEGTLPLADILAALPVDRVYGLEIPLRTEAEAGVKVRERMRRCVEGARALFAEIDERTVQTVSI